MSIQIGQPVKQVYIGTDLVFPVNNDNNGGLPTPVYRQNGSEAYSNQYTYGYTYSDNSGFENSYDIYVQSDNTTIFVVPAVGYAIDLSKCYCGNVPLMPSGIADHIYMFPNIRKGKQSINLNSISSYSGVRHLLFQIQNYKGFKASRVFTPEDIIYGGSISSSTKLSYFWTPANYDSGDKWQIMITRLKTLSTDGSAFFHSHRLSSPIRSIDSNGYIDFHKDGDGRILSSTEDYDNSLGMSHLSSGVGATCYRMSAASVPVGIVKRPSHTISEIVIFHLKK